MSKMNGGFTLPGEAGYEKLTLELARKWGADVIRDSDGTVLSDEILHSGYGIYSTICIIRDHNEWAKKNPDKLQQTFLITPPEVAVSDTLSIDLLAGFFREQFCINDSWDSMKYWQVWDRTVNSEVVFDSWDYADGIVSIRRAVPFHKYTVSFMAYRVWEEISMYNHTTNHWDKEHLMQLDPRHEAVRTYLKEWLIHWCETHPAAAVVRFTSLFYNFVWIWGSDARCRNLFTDWASYDFTVSPLALDEFARRYGYSLIAEDFVNGGKFHVTHSPCNQNKLDWMEFVNDLVVSFGRELIDIVHRFGRKAFVFYDDSWVGMEPYAARFPEFGFDGLIKCVFSGYEVRLCAGVNVPVHELRLHPYLFPVGLGGLPTFMEGGDPARDARNYWIHVRRALLRAKIDRIGLGGYLHLTQGFDGFCDCIEEISDEFRTIRDLHEAGAPCTLRPRIAVLHFWGSLRSWSLSGHFHETYMHDLIHINEALSGLPFDVKFISFDDVRRGVLADVDVVINAGRAGSAWSGGDDWNDESVLTALTGWVWRGGVFLGVNQPSAAPGHDTFFRMAHVLGVDEDTGERVCHGRWPYQITPPPADWMPSGSVIHAHPGIYLTDSRTQVFVAENGTPAFTVHDFGRGRGIYWGGFEVTPANTRLLMNTLWRASGETGPIPYSTDNHNTECAFFPARNTLVVINNTPAPQHTSIHTPSSPIALDLPPYASRILPLK